MSAVRSTLVVMLGLAALAGPARAEPVTPPAGWIADQASSEQLTVKAQEIRRFGGIPAAVRVVALVPRAGTGALWITRVEAELPAGVRDAATTVELGELGATARRAKAKVEDFAQRADVANKQLEATLRYRDGGVLSISRMVIAADAQRAVAITGECILDATGGGLEAPCIAALATLDPEIAPATRVPLSILVDESMLEGSAPTTADEPAGPATGPATELATVPPPPTSDGPRMDGGSRGTVMRMTEAKREVDRRPIYIGFGIVVLAAVFWWNRRRRERFERDDEDADDLAAAARGDSKDSP